MAAIEDKVMEAAHGKYAMIRIRNNEWGASVTTPCRAGDWVVIWKGGVHPAWERVREVVWKNQADCWMVTLQPRDTRGEEPAEPAGSVPRASQPVAVRRPTRVRGKVVRPSPTPPAGPAVKKPGVKCPTCGRDIPWSTPVQCSACYQAAADKRAREIEAERAKRDEVERVARREALQRSLGEAFDRGLAEAEAKRSSLESVFDAVLSQGEVGESAVRRATDNWRGIDASELWGSGAGFASQVSYLGVTYHRVHAQYGPGPDCELEFWKYVSEDGKVLCVYND